MKKLSNIADIIGGGTPSTKKSEYWDGDINWFSPVEIGDQEFVSTSQRRITEKGLEKSSAKMLPRGTVLFTSRAGIGKTAILSKEATTNQGFQSIVPKENDLDSYFLYSMTSILKRNAEKVGAGSTFSEVSKKQMEQIKLLIPILKEQKQIGRLFQMINRKINKQLHKIELLINCPFKLYSFVSSISSTILIFFLFSLFLNNYFFLHSGLKIFKSSLIV